MVEGLYRYTFVSRCEEDASLILGDESEIIFLNAQGVKGSVSADLKAFLDFLKNGVVTTELCRQIGVAVAEAKEHKEWRIEYMTLMMRDEEMREEGREEGALLKVLSLVEKGKLTMEEGAEELSCTVPDFMRIMEDKGFKISTYC